MGRKRGTSDGQPSGGVPRPAINRSQTFSIGTDENPQHTTTTSSATRTTTPNSSFYKTCPCPLERVDSRAPPSSPEYRSVFSPDSVLSPEASFGQTPSYRSRAQSIASGLSESKSLPLIPRLVGSGGGGGGGSGGGGSSGGGNGGGGSSSGEKVTSLVYDFVKFSNLQRQLDSRFRYTAARSDTLALSAGWS